MELYSNSVGLLREVQRVLMPGKLMVIASGWKLPRETSATDYFYPYQFDQLIIPIQVSYRWSITSDPTVGNPEQGMIIVVQQLPG